MSSKRKLSTVEKLEKFKEQLENLQVVLEILIETVKEENDDN
jgi:hypothetical protein